MNTAKTEGHTTITGRNQITLPSRSLRALGWERGDQLLVRMVGDDFLVLMRQPEDWTEAFAGRLGNLYGTHKETLDWIEQERRSWEPEPPSGDS